MVVQELAAILVAELNITEIDTRCKLQQMEKWRTSFYNGSSSCQACSPALYSRPLSPPALRAMLASVHLAVGR